MDGYRFHVLEFMDDKLEEKSSFDRITCIIYVIATKIMFLAQLYYNGARNRITLEGMLLLKSIAYRRILFFLSLNPHFIII